MSIVPLLYFSENVFASELRNIISA